MDRKTLNWLKIHGQVFLVLVACLAAAVIGRYDHLRTGQRFHPGL